MKWIMAAGGLVLMVLAWDRVQRLRRHGWIAHDAGLPEALFRSTVLAALQAIGAGLNAFVYAAIRQWARGYSGKPPWQATIMAWVLGKGQVWQDRRRLERSGRHVEINRLVVVAPKRRGRPPQYQRETVNGIELPGWYARRLTGRPPGRPRKPKTQQPDSVNGNLEPVNGNRDSDRGGQD